MFGNLKIQWKITVAAAFVLAVVFVNINSHNTAASSALIFAFAILNCKNRLRDFFTAGALFFTFVIDFFVGYSNYVLVIAIYFAFHLFAIARLYTNLSPRQRLIEISVRAGVILAAEIAALIIFREAFSFLHFFAILYFAFLSANVILSAIQIRRNAVFFAALLSFVISDFFIGMDFLNVVHLDTVVSVFYLLALALTAASLLPTATAAESAPVTRQIARPERV